jgi:hypothetical protein
MAPEKQHFVDIEPEVFEKEYLKPVHRVGFWTSIGVSAAMFVPPLLLYLIYGTLAPWEAIGAGMALALTYAVPFFFIEPISYYPVYGDAGNYMSMTTGNVSNLRLPCAAVAQAVAGVPEGTRTGAAIAAIGIAVSVLIGVTGVFIGTLTGGWITAQFPGWLTEAFKLYLLPAVWGAVFGQFALRGPVYALPALIIAGIPLMLGLKAYFTIPIAVFGTILLGWVLYKWANVAPSEGGD